MKTAEKILIACGIACAGAGIALLILYAVADFLLRRALP